MTGFRRLLSQLVSDWFLLALLALFPALYWLAPIPAQALPALVDWHTVSALAGLLVLSRG